MKTKPVVNRLPMYNIPDPASVLCDFYKISHRAQYPPGTELVYSTWIPRASRVKGINKVVAFGGQHFIKKWLIDYFNVHFFSRPKEEIVAEYKEIITATLGDPNPDTSHIEALHDLQYLPLHIKAVKEGTRIPLRVPMLTIVNTLPEYFWLVGYLETLFSCEMWGMATSATIGFEYLQIMTKYAKITGGEPTFIQFQGHDFSMRGMFGVEASKMSGAAHLLSFVGSDTIPAILLLRNYYKAVLGKELIGTSIPATEHSVMCANGRAEKEVILRLIKEVYPNGFLSIVSDTWDFWHVVTVIYKALREEIMSRDGRIVVRPDSGDPVLIICGDPNAEEDHVRKGLIEVLWEIFGGTINEMGFKVLDSHIGAIYGDSITLERCEEIGKRLMEKGFASTNIVYGIGSYTYQYVTRDTFGFAMKSTHVVVNGEEHNIFKDPKTDDGTKKSLTGRVKVVEEYGEIHVVDGLSMEEEYSCDHDLLEDVYIDGFLLRDESLQEVRDRIHSYQV